MVNAGHDDNSVTTLVALSNTGDGAIVTLWADPTTHRLLVSSAVSDTFGETPSGAINGSNKIFTLADTPNSGTLRLYLDGVRLEEGRDYTLSAGTITFTDDHGAPESGSRLLADYQT